MDNTHSPDSEILWIRTKAIHRPSKQNQKFKNKVQNPIHKHRTTTTYISDNVKNMLSLGPNYHAKYQ